MSEGAFDDGEVLSRVLNSGEPFAIIRRPHRGGNTAELLLGETAELDRLTDLEASAGGSGLLVIVPYRQIGERGFECKDDRTPLVALEITRRYEISNECLVGGLPEVPVDLTKLEFDISDARYQAIVDAVVTDDIGFGLGSNFVISRSLTGPITDPITHALSLFRQLLLTERGAYWTFVIHTGDRLLVGATPEAHLVLSAGEVTMNPISGTYRYPQPGEARMRGLVEFLRDQKEADELFMVVDEELKMMSRICDGGGVVTGPFLKEMAHLAHTEYLLGGRTQLDAVTLLRETMFAPTVVGSPLRSACRVVARREPCGRGYYSGVAALIDRDSRGQERMDSAILIRTIVIGSDGQARLSVGSTLVRESNPRTEMLETHAKAAAFLKRCARLSASAPAPPSDVGGVLSERNKKASSFWLTPPHKRTSHKAVDDRNVVLIDAEDDFSAMLATMLRSLGLHVDIVPAEDQLELSSYRLVVLGPGPGCPTAYDDPRVCAIRKHMTTVAGSGQPFLAVCLSHQILCELLGLPIRRLETPNQGSGRDVNIFGQELRLGFYNTYVAQCNWNLFGSELLGTVEVSRDPATDEVYALRGKTFESYQFHVESVLSRHGINHLAAATQRLLCQAARQLPA